MNLYKGPRKRRSSSRAGHEHDSFQSFLEPCHVYVLRICRLTRPLREPLSPALRDAEMSGPMEKFAPDPDDSITSTCLVPGERRSHCGTEDEHIISASRKCVPPPSGSRQRRPICHVSARSETRYCVSRPIAEATLDQQYDADVIPNVPTVLMNTTAPHSNWQPSRCQSRGSTENWRWASFISAVRANVHRPREAFSHNARLRSQEIGQRSWSPSLVFVPTARPSALS